MNHQELQSASGKLAYTAQNMGSVYTLGYSSVHIKLYIGLVRPSLKPFEPRVQSNIGIEKGNEGVLR